MKNPVLVDFQVVFESLPGKYLILFPDLTIAAASDAYLESTMTERNQILGRGVFDVFPDNPQDSTATGELNLRVSLSKVLQTGRTQTMAIQKYDIQKPNGHFEERFWSVRNIPVFDSQQRVCYILNCVEDVTELLLLKKGQERRHLETVGLREQVVEKELKILKHVHEIEEINRALQREILERTKSNELFSNLFEHNPASIVVSRLQDAKILNVNAAFLYTFGFSSREEVLGKTARELNIVAHPEQREELRHLLKEKKIVRDFEIEAYTKQGKVFWISTSILIIEIDETPCLFSISIDISNRKKVEEQLQALNRDLETFSYSVSHDLRSPLRSIDGYARILAEDYANKLDDDGKKVIATISRNAVRMGKLIDDMLSFSRYGKLELSFATINMNEVVERLLSELVDEKGRAVKTHVAVLDNVQGDVDMVRQVWLNYISNAIKYSGKKQEAEITISSQLTNTEVCYSIRDNGAGFDNQYASKLFGVFQRLHKQSEFEGTGVGLAICKRIVERHGGRVWAEGEPDKGATFYFSLPKQ